MNRKSFKKTTSLEPLTFLPNQRQGNSIFTRDLTPSEVQSLRNDKKQASEKARRYFRNKYKSP